jgi:hypothetical protein
VLPFVEEAGKERRKKGAGNRSKHNTKGAARMISGIWNGVMSQDYFTESNSIPSEPYHS